MVECFFRSLQKNRKCLRVILSAAEAVPGAAIVAEAVQEAVIAEVVVLEEKVTLTRIDVALLAMGLNQNRPETAKIPPIENKYKGEQQ